MWNLELSEILKNAKKKTQEWMNMDIQHVEYLLFAWLPDLKMHPPGSGFILQLL